MTGPQNIPPLDYASSDRRHDPRWFRRMVVMGIALGVLVIAGMVIHWLRKAT